MPGSRAKSWRFSAGYLKKSGDVSVSKVRRAQATAKLKSGAIGIKVSIMTPDIRLPDDIIILPLEERKIEVPEVKEGVKTEEKEAKKEEPQETKKTIRGKKRPVKTKETENGNNKKKRNETNE